ncbi:DMT family transporter [Thermodesulfobacteriota bacterium]
MKQTRHSSTYAALVAAVVFWGLSFVATKVALESLPTFTLVFFRFSIAACLFLFLMVYRGFPSFTGKNHAKILLIALFQPGLYFTFETTGLQHTSAPKAALIIATIPVVVFIFSAIFLKEPANITRLFGIGLSLVGITILVVGDPKFSRGMEGQLLGDLLIFGAVVSAALYMICARDLGQSHSALDITGMQVIYGAVFFAPAFLWELPGIEWSAISDRSLWALAYLTLFATIAAFLCYNHALTRIHASRAAVFINGIPVVTAFGAWILLGETLTLLQICGGVLVLFAVSLTNLTTDRAVPEKIEVSLS